MATAPRYEREMIFVGRRQSQPLAASLVFRTAEAPAARGREVRGWLGHGNGWETFLDEQWASSRSGSAWTIVPHGPLRVAAGGAGEVEALWFSQSGRSLRLEVDRALAEWNRGPTSRVHLFSGSLSVGGERTGGVLLELLHLRRPSDGADAPAEQILLTSGDSLTLLIATGGSDAPSLAWMQSGVGTREWTDARVMPRGSRALPEARREIPRGWGFVVPDAGIRGEVRPLGFAAEIGGERAGRRGVEARYTVAGWVEVGGRRVDVTGMVRHAVD